MLRVLSLVLLFTATMAAHSGPAYPILVDRTIGPVVASLWTDPDVGTGTFFVVVNPLPGGTIPSDLQFEIAVRPATGRLPEARYPMPRSSQRNQIQFDASVPFDAEERWNVRLIATTSSGGGEATTGVDVTPPGLGAWDLLLFSFPFLCIGFIWLRVLMKRRQFRRSRIE